MTCSRSPTSTTRACTVAPPRRSSSAALSRAPFSTSARTTFRPSAANRRAMASPIPLAAPVTTATCPARSSMSGAPLGRAVVDLLRVVVALVDVREQGLCADPLDDLALLVGGLLADGDLHQGAHRKVGDRSYMDSRRTTSP